MRQAAQDNPAAATTPVIFLKNVLIREPAYRAAFAAVSTPRSEVGEPLVRFIALQNLPPQPAAADEQLTFSIDPTAAIAAPGTLWAGAVWLTGDGRPTRARCRTARRPSRDRRDRSVSYLVPPSKALDRTASRPRI